MWILLLWSPLPTLGLGRAAPELSGSDLRRLASVSTFLALGHVLSTVAPAYGTVSFTNVVKTLEPLFTCAFSALFLGQVFALPVYLSLVPVIAGVIIASASEVSFSWISLARPARPRPPARPPTAHACSPPADLGAALERVLCAARDQREQVMSKPLGVGLSAQNLYATLTLALAAAALSLLVEGGTLIEGMKATIAEVGGGRFFELLLMTGVSHYLYNECAFIALSSVRR